MIYARPNHVLPFQRTVGRVAG